MRATAPDTITGGRKTAIWADGREIYFVMKFSTPFKSAKFFDDGRKCRIEFDTPEILVKTGISGVSEEGARKNLDAEIADWDFDRVRHSASDAWRNQLSRVRIQTANRAHKEIFYTALYHAFVSPTLFDDVDGQYRGMDAQVHQLPKGLHNYSTFSLWDTYRAAHPLYTLVQAERIPDLVNCLIRMSHESAKGVPVWPLQATETSCMTGYHSVVVIAEAAAKGFSGIDYGSAYGPMRQRVMSDDYEGLNHYRKFGYIPCDLLDESVSKSLGYAYDDWAVARVARAANATHDEEFLLRRSKNYRNLFDRNTNFVRPRLQNGAWAEPFDPKEISIMKKWKDFTESNSWQETFANQHDVRAYIELFGGRDAFLKKLDRLFNQSSDLPPDTPPDVAGLVGMYAHGNEPSHHIAYLYCYAGQPWKTQAMVRQLLETMYRNQPDGMAGNEDCGQMSAWYVMSALGFYAVDPASGHYVFGTPLFDSASIEIARGKVLSITAKRKSPADQYVHSIELNGKRHDKSWFRHLDIAGGGSIVFEMGSVPNKEFGTSPDAVPPSFVSD
jgi:predicted alpha-1,2-mannosidase